MLFSFEFFETFVSFKLKFFFVFFEVLFINFFLFLAFSL